MKSKDSRKFNEIIQELEDPKNIGRGSWALPRNATSLQKAKYELCKQILAYKQDNHLSTADVAEKIYLTTSETKEILFYHISEFTLDRLFTYAERLLAPTELQLTFQAKKQPKNAHAPA